MQSSIETRVGFFVLAAVGIFVYMGFQIGSFRFDLSRYNTYTMYFKDISGLSKKAEVKIAGVKVGWVEELSLIADHEMQAEAKVMILNNYKLYQDAYAVVRQDGFLGPKYLEIIAGDPLLTTLASGDTLTKPSTEPVSVDELMRQFKNIAANVEDVTETFKGALGGAAGEDQLKSIFNNLNTTAERLASFSEIVDRAVGRNEQNLDAFFEVGPSVKRVADKLEADVLPAFKESIEKISDVFDRDFNRVAGKIESTTEIFEEASIQIRDSFNNISSVAEKIDEGKGLIGKLINEDETYRDLKVAVEGIKDYFVKVGNLQIIFDSHFESMHRPAENYRYEDSKGYFDIRIHPNEDHFYVVQLATSEKGYVKREKIHRNYYDRDKDSEIDAEFCLDELNLDDEARLRWVADREIETYKRNTIKLGVQFGKVFNNIALRFGLFEGSAGLGIDFNIPFEDDKFRWVTTLEGYDFSGWNRKDDKRPHFKWLNRVHLMRNLYVTFGADDFVSKRNANAFFGAGIRFGDDDIKYLMSNLGGMSGLASDC